MGAYKISEELPDGWMVFVDQGDILHYLSPEGSKFLSEEAVHNYLSEEFDVCYDALQGIVNEQPNKKEAAEQKTKSEDSISRDVKADRKRLSKRFKRTSLRQSALTLSFARNLKSQLLERPQKREKCCQFSGNRHTKLYHLFTYISRDV